MEQQKSASSFPLDLTSEILLRLPAKSVVRFRCVWKLWLSITTDPYFINLFETRSPRPSLLLCFNEYHDELVVSSIPQHHLTLKPLKKSYSFSQPIDSYPKNFPDCSFFAPTESVHGLICFQESATPIVWNPSTRQFLTLPKPSMSGENITVFLGYDPIEGKHKVMCIPIRSSDVCWVLTLGSAQESWRTVKTKQKYHSDHRTSGHCIRGVVYYIARTHVWVLMSFDVRSEKFDMIQLPSHIHRDPLITYEGRLACIKQTTPEDCITLCILEDAEKRKWSVKGFVAPIFHFDESSRSYFKVKGITHAGEFIYVPHRFFKSYYILFCDPVRNSFSRFELKGIADEKSMLGNGYTCKLHAFPNHVESQMSL